LQHNNAAAHHYRVIIGWKNAYASPEIQTPKQETRNWWQKHCDREPSGQFLRPCDNYSENSIFARDIDGMRRDDVQFSQRTLADLPAY
jgi:hypothetical protein